MTLSSAPRRAHDREVHMSFVEFHDVSKVYTMGTNKIYAANGVDFTIEKGEFCVIVGPSGAGKTTVLNMLGGINWGLYGIFNFNLVSFIFQGDRTAGAIAVYVIIAIAALWLLLSSLVNGGAVRVFGHRSRERE